MQATLTTLACFTTPMEEQTIQMPYLWEDDRHFIHYRCLVMNNAIANMEDIIKMLDSNHKCELLHQLTLLKVNMGEPVTWPTKVCSK